MSRRCKRLDIKTKKGTKGRKQTLRGLERRRGRERAPWNTTGKTEPARHDGLAEEERGSEREM